MSKRFVTDKTNIHIQDNIIEVVGEEVHHINVLRHNTGDTININEYEIEITKLEDKLLKGKVIGKIRPCGVPKVNITLIASYLKQDKMEYVTQKAVELGVKYVLPVISKNTVVKFDDKTKLKKKERLEKIKKEAIEQCGRTDDVVIEEITELKNVNLIDYDAVIICHEKGNANLKEEIGKIKDAKNIAVVIGPEGGLDESEVDYLMKHKNTLKVCFGQRVLRAETASMYALSVLGYEFF